MLSKIQSIKPQSLMRVCDSITLDSGVTVPCITGQCSQVDVVSQNGYRYQRGFWDRILGQQQVQSAIQTKDVLGMIEHPTDDEAFLKTPYDSASHIVLKAWVQDGNPFATFGLLNNEAGNKLKALIDVGHRPGVSTRGLGSFGQDATSQFVSPDDYIFITWDIVRSPNFVDLKMDKVTDSITKSPLFRELTEMYQLRDSADIHYSESNLVKDIDSVINSLMNLKNSLLIK